MVARAMTQWKVGGGGRGGKSLIVRLVLVVYDKDQFRKQ